MLVQVHHLTQYQYPKAVQFTRHRILVYPRVNAQLLLKEFNVETTPTSSIRWVSDVYGNNVGVVTFDEEADGIRIEVTMTVELLESNPFDFIIEPHAGFYPFNYLPHERIALFPFLQVGSPATSSKVLPWLSQQFPDLRGSVVELLSNINQRIRATFKYIRRDEEGVQSPDETIAKGSGSCRDFALLFIEICRQLGIAARFVSGYLYDPPSGSGHIENVASGSTHAWAEIHLPGAGWKGFDPTNGVLANQNFIPCAVAIDPKLTSPIQGAYYHTDVVVPSSLSVELSVNALQ